MQVILDTGSWGYCCTVAARNLERNPVTVNICLSAGQKPKLKHWPQTFLTTKTSDPPWCHGGSMFFFVNDTSHLCVSLRWASRCGVRTALCRFRHSNMQKISNSQLSNSHRQAKEMWGKVRLSVNWWDYRVCSLSHPNSADERENRVELCWGTCFVAHLANWLW